MLSGWATAAFVLVPFLCVSKRLGRGMAKDIVLVGKR